LWQNPDSVSEKMEPFLLIDSKGFLFESDDTRGPILCRDVRGFQATLQAARDRAKAHSGRLVLVVPDLAMEDWLAGWADDVAHSRRTLSITRRTDGSQIRLVGTILAYGYGVDTTIRIERLEHQAGFVGSRRPQGPDVEPPPKSGLREVPGAIHHHVPAPKRRVSR
jgi:hypothetical protein